MQLSEDRLRVREKLSFTTRSGVGLGLYNRVNLRVSF